METFLTKAMNKLEPDRNKQDTIVQEKVQEKENKEPTVVPTNKNKIMYKQMTLSDIMNKGVQQNG